MAKPFPVIGDWYQDAVDDSLFEVVAVDDRSGTIELQYLGGELSEVDFETWEQMLILTAEAPEDWGASYEMSQEDRSDLNDTYVPESSQNPISSIEPDGSFYIEDF